LVAETWPDDLRAKAIGLWWQSSGIGFALAALVAGVVLRYANWRAVFLLGFFAVVTLWIQNRVPNPRCGRRRQRGAADSGEQFRPGQESNDNSFLQIFPAAVCEEHDTLLLLNFFGMFAWWGLVYVAAALSLASS